VKHLGVRVRTDGLAGWLAFTVAYPPPSPPNTPPSLWQLHRHRRPRLDLRCGMRAGCSDRAVFFARRPPSVLASSLLSSMGVAPSVARRL
jgi:hypothetical protein